MALSSTIRDLHRRKARERRHLALAEGIRLVEEMLRTGAACKGAVVSPALAHSERGNALRARLIATAVQVDDVTDLELGELAATEHPQGVVAVYEPVVWPLADLAPSSGRPLLVLDGVQDPGNVGTIARTALAFGASGLLALPGTADLANPKTVRGAAGALFSLPHAHGDDADLRALVASMSAEVWLTDVDGAALESPSGSGPLALIFGNEGTGVRGELAALATCRVAVPIAATVESLNVAVTAAIVLYQVTR
jgi:TrmH family RNA methyltransferase